MSRINLSILAILLVAFFAVSSQAADMLIMVGKDSTLTFTPQNGTVSKGDTLTFMFVGGTHSVLLADSGATKCNLSTKIANPKIAGATAAGGKNATYNVDGTVAKIWYYCGQPGHCEKGMWGLFSLSTGGTTGGNNSTTNSTTTDSPQTTPTDSSSSTMTMSMGSGSSMPSSMNSPAPSTSGSSGAGRAELSAAAVVGGFILYVITQFL